MDKITIKEFILKKGCDSFVYNFYDLSIDFFLLLLIHKENEVPLKLAFFEEGATFDNYAIPLNTDNTRTLFAESFEFKSDGGSLEFSLILLENYTHQTLSRAKIKKIIHQNSFIFSKNKGIQIYELIKIKIPINILQYENSLSFNNSIFSIQFSFKK